LVFDAPQFITKSGRKPSGHLAMQLSPMLRPALRLVFTLAVGVLAVWSTGYLISALQRLLEGAGIGMPQVLFLGVLAGSVVYVCIWAMDWNLRELRRFRQKRQKAAQSGNGP
jgi:hypothetical protein